VFTAMLPTIVFDGARGAEAAVANFATPHLRFSAGLQKPNSCHQALLSPITPA